MERVAQAIARDLPTLGQPRTKTMTGEQNDEAIEDRANDASVRSKRGLVRIERELSVRRAIEREYQLTSNVRLRLERYARFARTRLTTVLTAPQEPSRQSKG